MVVESCSTREATLEVVEKLMKLLMGQWHVVCETLIGSRQYRREVLLCCVSLFQMWLNQVLISEKEIGSKPGHFLKLSSKVENIH